MTCMEGEVYTSDVMVVRFDAGLICVRWDGIWTRIVVEASAAAQSFDRNNDCPSPASGEVLALILTPASGWPGFFDSKTEIDLCGEAMHIISIVLPSNMSLWLVTGQDSHQSYGVSVLLGRSVVVDQELNGDIKGACSWMLNLWA